MLSIYAHVIGRSASAERTRPRCGRVGTNLERTGPDERTRPETAEHAKWLGCAISGET
jgi:hypothetical protein